MADNIVFRFEEMRNAASQIEDIANRYKAASDKFQEDFENAVSPWEGTSKDKLKAFVNGAVNEYMGTTVPDVVRALAELLKANADQMEKADQQIADNIPSDLG